MLQDSDLLSEMLETLDPSEPLCAVRKEALEDLPAKRTRQRRWAVLLWAVEGRQCSPDLGWSHSLSYKPGLLALKWSSHK